MTVKLGGAAGNVTLAQKMMKGDDGGYYYPFVDENSNLSWVASEEGMALPPNPVNIAGPKGDKGDIGIYIGETEPAEDVLVWLNPEGEASDNLATKEYVDEAIAAIDIPEAEVDLSDYYTKTQTDEYFATIGYVDDAIEDIVFPEPDLSDYALKSEIPDVSKFQTEEQVNALIDSALGVIENGTY